MLPGSLTFLTPFAGLTALVIVLPVTASVLAVRRVGRAGRALGLPPPQRGRRLLNVLALVAIALLLGLAAAQPVLRSTTSSQVRTDAQAFFVIDVSRSMDASKGPAAPTRLARAVKDAIALRAGIPEIPSGIATLTDRALPNLFPNADATVFDDTMTHAIFLEQPPPENQNVVATSLSALGALGTQNFFPAATKRRLVVVLTDGESRPFDASEVAHALAAGPGARVVFVHVWSKGESVYDGSRIEQGYRENPESGQALATLASASGGAVFSEQQLSRATKAERVDVGTGPTTSQRRSERIRPFAPYLLLLLLLPLLVFLSRPGAWPRIRNSSRRRAGDAGARDSRTEQVGPTERGLVAEG